MAKFIGTEQEFLDLFGPTLLTNAVKLYTPKKVKGSTCRHCKRTRELQAAHLYGTPGRMEIAESILREYFCNPKFGLVEVDMHTFLEKFYEAHQPIKEHFIF